MKTIAVVEDNPDNRLLVSTLLDGLYLVKEYETGPEALAGFEQDRPDAVLLDISLPGMDGTEVLRRVRSHATLRTIPIIALTAHAMAGDRERYLALGFDDYVSKPIIEEDLLFTALKSCLEHGTRTR